MLEWDPVKRLGVEQILSMKWFEDVDEDIEIFSNEEKQQITWEFTYN